MRSINITYKDEPYIVRISPKASQDHLESNAPNCYLDYNILKQLMTILRIITLTFLEQNTSLLSRCNLSGIFYLVDMLMYSIAHIHNLKAVPTLV